jgi:hypothetical protein
MNKEEEQIASFKYLRILGSHLKKNSTLKVAEDEKTM